MLNLRELSAANPNTFGHGFEKHYLLQIYSIPDQWGIRVNIKLYSSEKSAGVPAMLWWNYPCIQAMVLGGFGMSSSACSRAGTRHEIRAIRLLARRFNPHDVRRAVIKIPVLCHFVVILGGIHMTQPRNPYGWSRFFFFFVDNHTNMHGSLSAFQCIPKVLDGVGGQGCVHANQILAYQVGEKNSLYGAGWSLIYTSFTYGNRYVVSVSSVWQQHIRWW